MRQMSKLFVLNCIADPLGEDMPSLGPAQETKALTESLITSISHLALELG
jgi:hypothetical protein